MSELRTIIRESDQAAYEEILGHARVMLERVATVDEANANPTLANALRGGNLGTLPLCWEASDAVTRAAHVLGIVASREYIGNKRLRDGHYLTSLAPLDSMPSDDDIVLCMTWGQFNPKLYHSAHPLAGRPFFGPRAEIAGAMRKMWRGIFMAENVIFRQVVHAPGPLPGSTHFWLQTTPGEIAAGLHSIRELPERDKLLGSWS